MYILPVEKPALGLPAKNLKINVILSCVGYGEYTHRQHQHQGQVHTHNAYSAFFIVTWPISQKLFVPLQHHKEEWQRLTLID